MSGCWILRGASWTTTWLRVETVHGDDVVGMCCCIDPCSVMLQLRLSNLFLF